MAKNSNDCQQIETVDQFIANEVRHSTLALRTAVDCCGRSLLRAVNPVRWFKRHPVSASIVAGAGLAGGAIVAVYAYRKRKEPADDHPQIHVHFDKPAGRQHHLTKRIGSALASMAMTQAALWIKSHSGAAQPVNGSSSSGDVPTGDACGE